MTKTNARFFAAFLLLSVYSLSFAVSQAPVQDDQIRIQLWADLDPFPGGFSSDDEEAGAGLEDVSGAQKVSSGAEDVAGAPEDAGGVPENVSGAQKASGTQKTRVPPKIEIFSYAIERTKEIAPFLMSGMLTGWSFEYTPSDKMRRVEEYWSFSEIQPFNPKVNHISFHAPKAMDDRLVCWAYCDRTPMQKLEYERWSSINHPHVRGIGRGPVEDGFEGIKTACGEALKNAVREYWRTMIKNKPKEISGSALVIRNPRIYIKDGNYVVDLDFFLETDKIVGYKMY